MSWTVPLARPQPSQLYLNGRKLSLATEWFDFDDPTYEPVPVIELDSDLVLSDGHTRAFLAWVAGATELRVVDDPDANGLNLPVYRRCVDWCHSEGITTIGDLAGRAVNAETWEEVWVARCQRLVDRVE